MSLTIEKAETQPHRVIAYRAGDTRGQEESIRITTGTFETPYGVMEFDKYFVTNHTLKRRQDWLLIRSHEVPFVGEIFDRINRAAVLGERAVRTCVAVFGAKLEGDTDKCDVDGSCVPSSSDNMYTARLPLSTADFESIPDFHINQSSDSLHGLYWLRISNKYFDVYADNPAHSTKPIIGVLLSVGSPSTQIPDLVNKRWHYADAILTPSPAELPGALGDLTIRSALLALRPGETALG